MQKRCCAATPKEAATWSRRVRPDVGEKPGTLSAPETADPLAACVAEVLDGVWVDTETPTVGFALTLSWTGRQPGSPE